MGSVSLQIHPSRNESDEIRRVEARLGDYQGLSHGVGYNYLVLVTGECELTFHKLRPRDIWRISSAIEECAVQAAPPEGWLEPPKNGSLIETAKGCAGCGGPLDENDCCAVCLSTELSPADAVIGEIESPDQAEQEFNLRLTRNSHELYNVVLHALSLFNAQHSPFTRALLAMAHAVARKIEPGIPADLARAQVYVSQLLKVRATQAVDIRPVTDC